MMIHLMRFGYWVVLLKSVNLTPLLVGIKPHKRTLHMKTYRFISTHETGFWSRPDLPTPYTGGVHHIPLTSLPLFYIQRTHDDAMSAGDQAWAFFYLVLVIQIRKPNASYWKCLQTFR